MAAEIRSNYENIPAFVRLRESLAQPHGASILALIMLDNKYTGLEMQLTFADSILFGIYVKHIITVWQKYEAEGCIIRSYCRNNQWTSNYGAFDNGEKAYRQIASDVEFGAKKNVIDVNEIDEDDFHTIVFTILRWNTPENKKLTLRIKKQ